MFMRDPEDNKRIRFYIIVYIVCILLAAMSGLLIEQ